MTGRAVRHSSEVRETGSVVSSLYRKKYLKKTSDRQQATKCIPCKLQVMEKDTLNEGTEKQRNDLSTSSFPKCAMAGHGQAKAMGLELPLAPTWVAGTQAGELSPAASQGVCFSRQLDGKQS